MRRVVVSGGGTGGHIMPAIAVAEALRAIDPSTELLFIGGVSGMETEIVPQYCINFQSVSSKKLRKIFSLSTVGVAASLLKGYLEARNYLKAFKADVVIGTGGYSAAATLLAANHLGIPTLVHEGNMILGRTNKMLAKRASLICTTFKETTKLFPEGKAVWTGLPLRKGIVAQQTITPGEARTQLGLKPDRFTLIVIGGSQGARKLNAVVLEAIKELIDADIQVLHQVGTRNQDEMLSAREQSGIGDFCGYEIRPFLNEDEMPLAWRAADLVLCRGGISTLAEANVNGVPALIVPLPTAYADHQTHNALAMQRGGAAIHLPETELNSDALRGKILTLKNAPDALLELHHKSLFMAQPNAAETVAKLALGLIKS